MLKRGREIDKVLRSRWDKSIASRTSCIVPDVVVLAAVIVERREDESDRDCDRQPLPTPAHNRQRTLTVLARRAHMRARASMPAQYRLIPQQRPEMSRLSSGLARRARIQEWR